MNELAMIAAGELAEFAAESTTAQAAARSWLTLMCRIEGAAHGTRGRVIAAVAISSGVSKKQVQNRWERWSKSRSYEDLIDRRRFPKPHTSGVSLAFSEYLCAEFNAHQRQQARKNCWLRLVNRWRAWRADPHNRDLVIPGHDSPPPPDPETGIPRGWSYAQICSRIKKANNRYLKTIRSQGPKAASAYLPKLHTTRVGLAFGEIIYFDDDVHDIKVNFLGVNSKPMRPLAFTAVEALSGCAFLRAHKPQIERGGMGLVGPDGRPAQGRMELSEVDFFWFVVTALRRIGWNSVSGTRLVMEHGTANIPKWMEEGVQTVADSLAAATGGMVTVDRSGTYGDPAFKGMVFGAAGAGNFRFKAPVESWFNLFRNRADLLPNPTGRHRDLAPEEQYGMDRSDAAIIRKILDGMTPERAMSLRMGSLHWEEYCYYSHAITAAINEREDHDLEGWAALGFVGKKVRLDPMSDHWLTPPEIMALPLPAQAALLALAEVEGHSRLVRMSPREVYDRMTRESPMKKLPDHLIPLIAPSRAWRDATVTQELEFVVRDMTISAEQMRFMGVVTDPRGHEIHLRRGESYRILLNHLDPTEMWVAEAGARAGAFIGVARLINRPCKTDEDALHRRLGEIAHVSAGQSAAARAHAHDEMERRIAAREHNREVLAADGDEDAPDRRKRLGRSGRISAGDEDEFLEALAEPVLTKPQTNDNETDEHDIDIDDIL